ncbi:uncharacterized protein LOC117175703 isoform X2 [Belonocnema kinseyi]|uniref:uncharacterized protein LOC117175703 isoform X2 n=1 Tax=Belonocnema kinseyi TaxID=2817044 RepID=UPI00143CC6FA|nr:uncharacterized protein LOC117175703 isoform X2 [Belonocnema kinseyi]
MNLSDYSSTKVLMMMIPQGEIPLVWKGYATKISILAFALGSYFLIFRNRKFPSLQNWFRKSKKSDPNENKISREKILRKNLLAYNHELCPICLGTPKFGVKAVCGHLLCATCLASYCEAREVSAPPPCPLCRAPLDTVTLATEQGSTLSLTEFAKADINSSEKTLAWIREYNHNRGQIAYRKFSYSKFFNRRTALFVNFLTLCLVIALIETRVQALPWVDWVTYGSFLGITLSILTIITLVICVWLKYQNQVTLN